MQSGSCPNPLATEKEKAQPIGCSFSFFLLKYFADAKCEIILFENCEIFGIAPECEMK